MGSINCKEYSTTSNDAPKRDSPGATGSYQSTCESSTSAVNNKMAIRQHGSVNSTDYTDPVRVCHQKDIEDNSMKQVSFDENTRVLLIKQNGQLKAIGSKCTHYGAPLHTGSLGQGRVRCPWHGACFNIDNGDIEDFPGLDSLPCYNVQVAEDGGIMLRAKRSDLEKSKRLKNMVKRDPKDDRVFVVVGGGPSGAVCVETLRQEGFTGRLVFLCRENVPPYDRVKISKSMNADIATLQLRDANFYAEYDIELMLNVEATKLNTVEKTLHCSNGFVIKYNKIYIATGSSAYKPPIPGANLKNVFTVRDYNDANAISAVITPESRVVCLGSSFISLEAAAALAKKVASVTVVGRDNVPLKSILSEEIGERVLRLFEENGVEMRMESGITEVLGDYDGKVTAVRLLEQEVEEEEEVSEDGTESDRVEDGEEEQVDNKNRSSLPCDLLIMGTGSTLNTGFLANSGVRINLNGSIDVNDFLQTNVPDVYVGGDIANAHIYSLGGDRATIGHYQLAQYHGRVAAINMSGSVMKLQAVPFFFTMIFGKGIRYSGYGKFTDVIIDGDLESLKFVAYYINQHDSVIAVASCGRDPIVAQFAELQSQGKCLHRSNIEKSQNRQAWTAMLKDPLPLAR